MRKKDSSDYEPDSLRVMLASLDRHLTEAGSRISIAKDGEFVNSRKVLEGKEGSKNWYSTVNRMVLMCRVCDLRLFRGKHCLRDICVTLKS